ncbi:hypothetical protein, variant 2 [Aphanomyces astaci]|uniref:Telomeric single stranded DNA binding POT1/Cdc13 domain-containing protein n=1 Tax=Aphanomyces astaci TaxID=112090 RepID=W4FLZ6_APHAT|nr:hypothetical protein, variant 2 [Aphanomyces astaci]ETV67839.1 hypothetical protein, variant 2 [Aphanomyces astaci]|eukprot:XP_009842704.1 hypothetical protein, variant 2 [Aphanomyces astaci]
MDVEPWLQNTRVKNVWPLRSLPLPASPFDIGGGPCARVASRVVSMELTEILTSPWSENMHPRRIYVHFYDSWADHVQHFVQHFKVSLAGHGLIQMEADTESSYEADAESAVVVVAERSLLSRCELMGQWSRDDTAMAIELKYQAATRANSASPIVYALEQVVTSATVEGVPAAAPSGLPHQKKPNNRGLRGVCESKIHFYSPLSCISSQGNIYGVVSSYTKPKLCDNGRRDYEMTVSLIDESRPLRSQALYVNVFAATVELLPNILCIGDILRIHKLILNKYDHHDVGTSSSTVSVNAVIRQDHDGTLKLLHAATTKPTVFTSSDYDRCLALMTWSKQTLAVDTTLPPRNTKGYIHLAQCKSLESRDIVDILAKVIHISQPENTTTSDSGTLDISDGHDDETTIPVHVHVDWAMLTSRWLVPAAAAGLQWVKLRAVELELKDDGAMAFHFRAYSTVEILPNYLYEVRHALERSEPLRRKRSSTVVQPPPTSAHHQQQQPYPTLKLAELLTLQPPRMAYCSAQVVDVWVSDLPISSTPGPSAFSCVLRLQDSSASVDAILHGLHAVVFALLRHQHVIDWRRRKRSLRGCIVVVVTTPRRL